MNEKDRTLLDDLLIQKALYGLDEADQAELDGLSPDADTEFRSLELTAAAIGLADAEIEPMPAHLRAKIEEDADRHFAQAQTLAAEAQPWPPAPTITSYSTSEDRGSGWFGWLGWAVAAAACVALGLTFYLNRPAPEREIANTTPPQQTVPPAPTNAQMRDEFVKTAADIIRASWAAGNVKGLTQVVGDIVWSEEKQAGYMTFKNLPPNPTDQYTYQLWIMDPSQEHPIDGGTFDVNAQGEIVVPITPKLKAKTPDMFAVTMEKPGGVPVSKKDKIVSIAKVETRGSPNS
jgi:hypothetical protein